MSAKRFLNRLILNRGFNTVTNAADILYVPVTHIKRTLDIRNIECSEGFTSIILEDCPLECQDRIINKKFYVNKITGLFVCHSCGRTGPWTWLERRLMESSGQPLAASKPCIKSQIEELSTGYVPVATAQISDVRRCLNDLNLQHVTVPMLAQLGACINTQDSSILLPLRGGADDNVGGWTKLSKNESGRPNEQVLGSTRQYDVSQSPLLLASATTWSSDYAVLVPTACDFLALACKSIPAICLAAGPKHLPLEVLPLLEQFSKIVLWFGEYTSTARAFSHKLGESRCFLVRPREGIVSPHEVSIDSGKKQQLLSIVNEAQPATHPAIVNFRNIRVDVRSELERGDLALGTQWKRFPKLNNILGGFRPGEVTILSGPTGSGKTTFLSEYSLDLCLQGINTLWGSFEIRNTRLAKTMITQLAGYRVEKSMDKFDEIADILESLPLHFMAFHGQQPLKKVMEVVNHATYVHDLGHIIIDNVQFMLGLGQGSTFTSRFILQDQVIEAFRSHASAYNCHITLVIHPRKEAQTDVLTINSVYGSAKATQEADNVLLIQNQTAPIGKKFLQVVKNRYAGTLGSMLLDFNKESLSYEKKTNPTVKLYDFLNGHVTNLKKVPIKMSQ